MVFTTNTSLKHAISILIATSYGRDHVWVLGIMSGVKYACSGAFTIEYPSHKNIYYLNSHVIVLLEYLILKWVYILLECFSINNFSGKIVFQCDIACNSV